MKGEQKVKKEDFYPLVGELFREKGYTYYPERAIKGMGRGGSRKPDFVATDEKSFIIGEIKSPAEPPQSSSWRTVQSYDSSNMREVRERVRQLERSGQLSPEVGGHAIILFGQLEEYLNLMGDRWLPPEEPGDRMILLAYAYPIQWKESVEQVLETFSLLPFGRLRGSQVEVTIFSPGQMPKKL